MDNNHLKDRMEKQTKDEMKQERIENVFIKLCFAFLSFTDCKYTAYFQANVIRQSSFEAAKQKVLLKINITKKCSMAFPTVSSGRFYI